VAKALIVDDEVAVIESFKMILGMKNFDVNTAQNIDEAEKVMKQGPYDIAFIDMRFHNEDLGLVILKKLKEIDPNLQAVICTAFASEETKIQAIEIGAMDYISKPFTVDAIYELADMAIEHRKKQKG